MTETTRDLLLAATAWCGGVTVTIFILALIGRRYDTAALFGGFSAPLGIGVLYLIFT